MKIDNRNFPRVCITLPPIMLETIKQYGIEQGLTRSAIIQFAVRDWFDARGFELTTEHGDDQTPVKQKPAVPLIFGQPYDRDKPWSAYLPPDATSEEIAANLVKLAACERRHL